MEASSIVHIVLCILFAIIGLSANSILMLAIVKSRSNNFRSYSIILFAQSTFEFVGTLANVVSIMRIVDVGCDLVAVFYGPCVFVSDGFCSFTQRAEVRLAGAVNVWFLLSFMYRYYVIVFNPLTVRQVSICTVLMWAFCLTVFIQDHNEVTANITETMQSLRPDIDLEGLRYYAFSSNVLSIGMFLFFTIFFGILLVCLFIARRKIMKSLQTSNSLRESTKSLQKDFINALTAQGAVIMLSLWPLATFWLIPAVHLQNHFIEASAFMAHNIQFALSPLTTIYFVRPYQRFVLTFVGNSVFEAVNLRCSLANTSVKLQVREDKVTANVECEHACGYKCL